MSAILREPIATFVLGVAAGMFVVLILLATTSKPDDPAPCKRPVFVKSLSGDGWESLTYRCQDGSLLIRELVK